MDSLQKNLCNFKECNVAIIENENGGIAGVLSSIFDEESRHFFSKKSARIKRFGYSPITGKRMRLITHNLTLQFRRESFDIESPAYQCVESGEIFSTSDQDELALLLVENAYRHPHNIPFPYELKKFKNQLRLSSLAMSRLFEFGEHTYRKYEQGEIPTIANAKQIRTAMMLNVEHFEKILLFFNTQLNEKES